MRVLRNAGPGYVLVPLAAPDGFLTDPVPGDFLVRAEDFGVPQRRHRVIIVGIRCDVAAGLGPDAWPALVPAGRKISVAETLAGMSRLLWDRAVGFRADRRRLSVFRTRQAGARLGNGAQCRFPSGRRGYSRTRTLAPTSRP